MQIANDPTNRIRLEEGKQRRRQLIQLFFKYIKSDDITILPTMEYNRILTENSKLASQLKLINELRQAEADRRDVHRPV